MGAPDVPLLFLLHIAGIDFHKKRTAPARPTYTKVRSVDPACDSRCAFFVGPGLQGTALHRLRRACCLCHTNWYLGTWYLQLFLLCNKLSVFTLNVSVLHTVGRAQWNKPYMVSVYIRSAECAV